MKFSSALLTVALLTSNLIANAADLADGTVLAYDRVARILVFTDKTIWSLENLETAILENVVAGSRVQVSYESNEDDGVTAIHSIKVLP